MAKCPYCGHKWSYKEKLLRYSLKPRTRTRCKNCKEYIEPSTRAMLFDYIAVMGVALSVFIFIPILNLSVTVSVSFSIVLMLLYVFVFVPVTVDFKHINYRKKDKV